MREQSKNDWDARRAHKRSDVSGLIGPPVDPDRRERCRHSLRLFLETYFPAAFPLGWSDDHLEVIEKTQTAVMNGGQFALAMPRASGKTTINLRAAIWAMNYGLSPYVFIVCADARKARQGLKSIKTEYEYNPLLCQDFQEICIPIRELQGASLAAKKQHIDGVPTLIDWTADVAQLPTVAGSAASGAMIGVGGITGAARGAQITLPDGTVKRPTLLLIDDFQTRESAASTLQSKTRLDILNSDLLCMKGPKDPLAALATVTVIYQGDAADQLLDRKKFPHWHGVRKKLVYSWPKEEKLWEEYAELLKTALREDREPVESLVLYETNFEIMNAGGVVAWPERYYEHELSAIQHAFNLKIADPDGFEAEYQNSPASLQEFDLGFLTADQIAEKLNNFEQGKLPPSVQEITAAIDVQGNSLWWIVVAWANGFTGYVCDYGCFPKQGRNFFSQRELPVNFFTLWPDLTEEEAIYKALGELCGDLLSRKWTLGNGAILGVSRLLIDEGWRDKVVHLFCGNTQFSSVIMPAKGWGIRAGRAPMGEWHAKDGERVGWNWRSRLGENNRSLRHIIWDANHWKTFVQQRLKIQMGGNGCLSLWGSAPMPHRLFAQHLTAESYVQTEGHGRKLVEWTPKPAKPDNHWLDALAMSAVAASERGIKLIEQDVQKKTPAPLSLSAYAAQAQGR